MPMRTVEPVTSITSMQTSLPTLIFSPGRLVMMSIANSSLENGSGRLLRRRPLEQRGTNGSVGGLVDDLVAAATRDQDRRIEVGTKALQRIRCTNRHVDGRVVGLGQADARRFVVGELDLVVAEEPERVRHRDGEIGVLDRVQPHECAVLVASEQGVAIAAKPDEAAGELDDRLIGDIEHAEAAGVQGYWHVASGGRWVG